MRAVCVTMWLSVLAPYVLSEDIVADLDQVTGIRWYRGSESGKALLKRNGFVVVPRFYRRIFMPYLYSGLRHFVTADSVHRTFHAIFEDQLKRVELAHAAEVAGLTMDLAGQLRERGPRSGEAPDDHESLVSAYFGVAAMLLGEEPGLSPAQKALAEKELRLIHAAREVTRSPIFGYQIDYTQFKPRGFYTDTPLLRRYFKVMSWYGNAGFRLKSDRETRAAMQIAGAFVQDGTLLERWQRIDRVYSFLLAPCDDLTPQEYADLVARLAVKDLAGDPLDWFRKQATKLRDPRICSTALTQERTHEWVAQTKGMRLFGKRYVPDSEIFMSLTHPNVPGRGLPSGLDVMAANGSARAKALATQSAAGAERAHLDGLEKAASLLVKLKDEAPHSHYVEFLRLAGTLYAPPVDEAPAFAKTPAYADKNLMTGLAAWASTRHAWALHAKQSVAFLGWDGEPEPVPGYVEPNPAFFEAMRELTRRTIRIFRPIRGVQIERLEGFQSLTEELATIVEKELAGKPFSKEEIRLLHRYPHRIASLQGFDFNVDITREFPWMCLVCDVHSEMLRGQCLEVGTGGAMPMYVVVRKGEVSQLLAGGVYSYYEFAQPISNRLTDEQWRDAWESGKLPAMPGWTSSFVAEHDAGSIVARILAGERVREVLYVNDPGIESFLWEAIQPGGKLSGRKNYNWALEAAAARLGRKMAPLLFDILREAAPSRPSEEDWITFTMRRQSGRPVDAAANALAMIISKEDLPTLTEMALGDHRGLAALAFWVGSVSRSKVTEDFLMGLMNRAKDRELKERCMRVLAYRASKDVSPYLIRKWRSGKKKAKLAAMRALGDIWDADHTSYYPRLPTRASDADMNDWGQQIEGLTMETLRDRDHELKREAVCLAGVFRVTKAVPIIAEASVGRRRSYAGTARALARIGTEEAVSLLIGLTAVESPDDKLWVIRALKEVRPRRAVPRLRELLSDEAKINGSDRRVCDHAADALAAIVEDGPGFDLRAKLPARDAKIREWKAYLNDREGRGDSEPR